MKYQIARWISIIFNPLILSIIATFMLSLKATNNLLIALLWMGLVAISALAIMLTIFFGMKRKFLSNFDVSDPKQRPFLFVITGIACLFLFIIGFLFHAPHLVLTADALFFVGVILYAIILRYAKVSTHTALMAGVTLGMVLFFGTKFLPVLVFIPIMIWSRLVLKRHTFYETLIGSIVGFIVTFAIFWIDKLAF